MVFGAQTLALGIMCVDPRNSKQPAHRLTCYSSYGLAKWWVTCRLHSAALAAAVCENYVEPGIATTSPWHRSCALSHDSGTLVVPTLCKNVSRSGLPSGAVTLRPASCCYNAGDHKAAETMLAEATLADLRTRVAREPQCAR